MVSEVQQLSCAVSVHELRDRVPATGTQKLLNDKLIDIESNINLIKKEIVPINTTIESLKKQSSNLYSVISESYPSLSMEEIQRQVINYLTKNNLL